MLAALETRLLAHLHRVHGDSIQLAAGPALESGPRAAGVSVHARSWDLQAQASGNGEERVLRGPAHGAEIATWDVDGTISELVLPAAATGVVIDVEVPPGVRRKLGEEYQIFEKLDSDDPAGVPRRTIAFFSPPPPGKVVARLRGEPARGFSETRPGRIALLVTAWGRHARYCG